ASRLLVASQEVASERPHAPLYLKLAGTGNPGEMRLTWLSTVSRTPVVRVGTAPGQHAYTFSGAVTTYSADEMCGAPANIPSARYFRDPGYIHQVVLLGLEPEVEYFFVYGAIDILNGMGD
ncbi:hypothetical protein CYMTET_22032, partial [Cymbomonas tetramitiformis]